MEFFFIIIVLLTLLTMTGLLRRQVWVVVPAGHVGIVTRRFGRSAPDTAFQKYTPYTARGVQARVLLPDRLHWLLPVIHQVEIVPEVAVPADKIGLVTAHGGHLRRYGSLFGRHVECDSFQDGQAFLLGGGEQGRQAATLAGGQSYYINTRLFTVDLVDRTRVQRGTVGLVEAKAGRIKPPDRQFGRHVECDSFQDGAAFLAGGGERGRQLAVLGGGASYDINPELFDVITTHTVDTMDSFREGLTRDHLKEIYIPPGHTGVVVTLAGAEPAREATGSVGPRIEGHSNFRRPWVFLDKGGQWGVQEETLGEATLHALNPWFVQVILIPTRQIVLQWRRKQEGEQGNYDAELGQIGVTVQGHRLLVDMSQGLRIPRQAAPRLVSEFGGLRDSGPGGLVDSRLPVQRFARNVLGNAVAGHFNGIANASTVVEFLGGHAETRMLLTDKVRSELKTWGVEALSTTLGDFEPEDPSLNAAFRAQFAADMERSRLETEVELADLRDQADEKKARAERRRAALELQAEVQALGAENAAMIRILREFTNMKVPDYIGGGDIAAYVQALPMASLPEVLSRLRELSAGEEPASGTARSELTRPDPPEEPPPPFPSA